MTTTQIMKVDRLEEVFRKTTFVERVHFEQFITAVLSWYQEEAETPIRSTSHFFPPISKDEYWLPPNVFDVFEFPVGSADCITNIFYKSQAHRFEDEYGMDKDEAMVKSVEYFNHGPEVFEHMLRDTTLILDAYNMFYFYGDDGYEKDRFQNPFVREVW